MPSDPPDCEAIEVAATYASPFSTPGGWATFESWPIAVLRVSGASKEDGMAVAAHLANRAATDTGWARTPFVANDAFVTGSRDAERNAHV